MTPSVVLRFVRRKPLGAIGGAIVLVLLVMARSNSALDGRAKPVSARQVTGTSLTEAVAAKPA